MFSLKSLSVNRRTGRSMPERRSRASTQQSTGSMPAIFLLLACCRRRRRGRRLVELDLDSAWPELGWVVLKLEIGLTGARFACPPARFGCAPAPPRTSWRTSSTEEGPQPGSSLTYHTDVAPPAPQGMPERRREGGRERGRQGARSTVRARWPEGRRIRGDGERSGTAKMPNEKGGIPIEMEKRGG